MIDSAIDGIDLDDIDAEVNLSDVILTVLLPKAKQTIRQEFERTRRFILDI